MDDEQQSFFKDELHFTKDLPECIDIECPICHQVMLNDPYQTTCGHHFCGSCIKKSNGPCPMCMTEYTAVPDENRLRIINNLQVTCTNKESGCKWKGKLKDLIGHVNKGKRDGKCKFEEVKCRYAPLCTESDQRRHLDNHERKQCQHRPYTCEYCDFNASYEVIKTEHYNDCGKYPVSCTNRCEEELVIERDDLQSHLDKDCPLEQVECDYKWAGCCETPLRKDLPQHIDDSMKSHLSLLAVACGEMKKVNDTLTTILVEKRYLDKKDLQKHPILSKRKSTSKEGHPSEKKAAMTSQQSSIAVWLRETRPHIS